MKGRGRTQTVKVYLSPAEKEAWEAEADGEALAVWIRQTITRALYDRRREALVIELDKPIVEPEVDDTNPEIEDDLPIALLGVEEARQMRADARLAEEWSKQLNADSNFDPQCPNAVHHWQLARGAACPGCGGSDR